MFMSKPEHFLIIARPMRPSADDGDGLACDLVAKKGRMVPRATSVPTRRSLTHLARQHASMKKANSAVASVSPSAVLVKGPICFSVGPVDVCEADDSLPRP
jgi:hypothetical protein